MDVWLTLWLLAVAIGASALGGMLGMAGGIFIVPILTAFGHIDIHTAIAASIVSVIACSCSSASSFLVARMTNIRLAIVLEVATTTGALTGVLLSGILPVALLYGLFGIILVVSAYQMQARRRSTVRMSSPSTQHWGSRLGLDASYPEHSLGRSISYRVERLPLGLTLMYGAGMISALLGIGSGVLKIPAMDSALRLPIKVSSATSNFMIGVTAAASAGAYFLRGDIVSSIAGPVALGSVAGSLIGARLLMRLPSERMRALFVAVLLVLAAQMLLSAAGVEIFGGSA